MSIPTPSLNLILTHILPAISSHRLTTPSPFFLSLTGLQGSGKSTWASSIASALRSSHGLKVIVFSLDDLYHTHANLLTARDADASNQLLRTRGQPGTHDTELAKRFFAELRDVGGKEVAVPAFDKSAFDGAGDRVPEAEWERVSMTPAVDVVIFEGWCVGFTPISADAVRAKWEAACAAEPEEGGEEGYETRTLQRHELRHLLAVNENLRGYCEAFMGPEHFDYFVHLDTDDLVNVYRWRIGQEHTLWRARGKGMSDEQVVRFVQGYMPSYELYLEGLRERPFVEPREWNQGSKNSLRVVLDVDRGVTRVDDL